MKGKEHFNQLFHVFLVILKHYKSINQKKLKISPHKVK